MITVSVIIPAYNHFAYILGTLDSVFAQTYTNYEVIVVNDGSPDRTASVLRPLVEAGRVTYLEQANAGQAAARNRGLAEARGEFIAFLDDDDLWPPDKLEWQVAELRAQPDACLVAGSARVFKDLDQEICIWDRAEKHVTIDALFECNPITSPGQTLIRRRALDAVGGLREEIWGADDWDLYFRLLRQGSLVIRDRVALHYRAHGANASHDSLRMVANSLKVIRENLPDCSRAERLRLELLGTNTILRNYVGLIASKWKKAWRHGDWRVAMKCLLILGKFRRLIAAEPRLLKVVVAAFCPTRLRNIVSRLQQQFAPRQQQPISRP